MGLFGAMAVLVSCSHTLNIESDPSGADVMVSPDLASPGKVLGQTPLALDSSKDFPSGSAFITIQKTGFQRLTLLISPGGFGGFSETVNVKLQPGLAAGSLASQMMTHVRNAQRLSAALQFDQAHAEIDKAIALDPTFTFGLSFKAGMFFVQRNFKEAERYYRMVLQIDPRYEEAIRMLAKLGVEKDKLPAGGTP
jgi:tetratricopeptide (TPR) repeat protein